MKRFLASALSLVLCCLCSWAQNSMDVGRFSAIENDLMARVTKPVRDTDEGKLCALIKVYTDIPGLEARPDALGIVQQEQHDGQLWLYVPYGARSISFSAPGYYPLMYKYPESINEGTVYELRLSGLANANGLAHTENTQLFVLTYSPENATIYVDDIEQQGEAGVFTAMMSKGDHTWKVEAPEYEEASGEAVLEDAPVREDVKLQPLFATFSIRTLPEDGFEVMVNDKLQGVTPFVSRHLDPGTYRVRVQKKDFYPVDTLLRLREGDKRALTIRLTSHADSLFYNRELGGRRFSFGVKAAYILPFVTAKGSGGFTGSALNYGIGTDAEKVNFGSQSGFAAGLQFDYKLVKNLYLVAGIDWRMVKYDSKFSHFVPEETYRSTNSQAYIGSNDLNFKESYTDMALEIPVMASYRFVMTKYSSVHLNLGPWFRYGLSSKMKVAGSNDMKGNIYAKSAGVIVKDKPVGTYEYNNTYSANIDMFGKKADITKVNAQGAENTEEYDLAAAPFKRFNAGLKLQAVYELRGFQLGAGYSLQLTNMADGKFWQSDRIPVLDGKLGANNMSGYSQRIHSLEISLAYMFRY